MSAKDYYAVLGIPPTSSSDQIQNAFLAKAEEHHPDRGGSPATMMELCEAAEVLASPANRSAYDRLRTTPEDPVAQRNWRGVASGLGSWAQSLPAQSTDLRSWLNSQALEVQKTLGGRILAGLVAGLIFGGVLGLVLAHFMHLNAATWAAIGAVAGAAAGSFAAASNE